MTDLERLKDSFEMLGVDYHHASVNSYGYQSLDVWYGQDQMVSFNFDETGMYDSVD